VSALQKDKSGKKSEFSTLLVRKKAGYLLPNKHMSDIRLSKSSARTLDIEGPLLLM